MPLDGHAHVRVNGRNAMSMRTCTVAKIWELPLTQDYMDMIKSDVADIKNIGIGI